MKVYIKRHDAHAGKWIYNGYESAWRNKGFDTHWYTSLEEITPKDSYIMCTDGDINQKNLEILEESKKTFMFTQPNTFPEHWGTHPNFVTSCTEAVISQINSLDNVKLWTWAELSPKDKNLYWTSWKDITTVPLAFDSYGYRIFEVESEDYQFDICFIGGRANNGFDEKIMRMMNHYSVLGNSGLRFGFFVGQNISHEQENEILCKSRIAINIHDSHHLHTGFDTNERTYKSLALTGAMVSDMGGYKQMKSLFPNIPLCDNPQVMLKKIGEFLSFDPAVQKKIKQGNRQNILNHHTYSNRVEKLLSL